MVDAHQLSPPEPSGETFTDAAEVIRRFRKDARLTGDQLAARTGMSQSKISKIENRRLTPSERDLTAILDALVVTPAIRERVLSLSAAATARIPRYDRRLRAAGGVEDEHQPLATIDLPRELSCLQPAVVPWILQTAEYMQALHTDSPRPDPGMPDLLRMQDSIFDRRRFYSVLLTETTLHNRVLPAGAMLTQLDKIKAVMRLPNVRIGLIRRTAELPKGLVNGFEVHDQRLVIVDTFTTRIVHREATAVASYRQIFATFGTVALFDREADRLLDRIASEYVDTTEVGRKQPFALPTRISATAPATGA